MTPNRVDLIGYRGAGKSTVGALLADRLGWQFIDSDWEIERQGGRTIVEMFQDSVPEFRRLESDLLRQLQNRTHVVVAWGGGVVLSESNRKLMQDGLCVWLTAGPDELYRRTQTDPNTPHHRPALTTLSGPAEVEQVLNERQPLYAETAKLVISTEDRTPEEVAAAIVEELHRQGVS